MIETTKNVTAIEIETPDDVEDHRAPPQCVTIASTRWPGAMLTSCGKSPGTHSSAISTRA